MPKKTKSVVCTYHGPFGEIPWSEMLQAIKAHVGGKNVLALTLTCDVADRIPSGLQPDEELSFGEPPFVVEREAGAKRIGKRATIDDVAREAGVSHTTVSRVANSELCVRSETRARVEEAMTRLNYEPNEAARAMGKLFVKRQRDPGGRLGYKRFGDTWTKAARS